jgi:hypothetical protein
MHCGICIELALFKYIYLYNITFVAAVGPAGPLRYANTIFEKYLAWNISFQDFLLFCVVRYCTYPLVLTLRNKHRMQVTPIFGTRTYKMLRIFEYFGKLSN